MSAERGRVRSRLPRADALLCSSPAGPVTLRSCISMENDTIKSFMTLPLSLASLRLEFVLPRANVVGTSKWIKRHSGAVLLRHHRRRLHWSLNARLSRGQSSQQEILNGSINISESTSWVRVTGTESTIDGFSCFGQSPI
jgi:hypothetical protein